MPYQDEVIHWIEKEKLGDKIRFIPFLPINALKAFYQLSSAFIFPSFHEGFGLPVIEALWQKTPVVTTNSKNFKEAGAGGCLYGDPSNSDELGQLLCDAVSNNELKEALVEDGYRHVQKFHWKETGQKLVEIYTSLSASKL